MPTIQLQHLPLTSDTCHSPPMPSTHLQCPPLASNALHLPLAPTICLYPPPYCNGAYHLPLAHTIQVRHPPLASVPTIHLCHPPLASDACPSIALANVTHLCCPPLAHSTLASNTCLHPPPFSFGAHHLPLLPTIRLWYPPLASIPLHLPPQRLIVFLGSDSCCDDAKWLPREHFCIAK